MPNQTLEFTKAIKRFRNRVKRNADAYVQGVAKSIARSVVDESPVLEPNQGRQDLDPIVGRLKGSWHVSNSPRGSMKNGKPDPDGGRVLREMEAAIDRKRAGGVFYIVNNVTSTRSDPGPAGVKYAAVVNSTSVRFGTQFNKSFPSQGFFNRATSKSSWALAKSLGLQEIKKAGNRRMRKAI